MLVKLTAVLEGPYHFQNNIPNLIPTPTFESGNHISSTFQADHNRHRPSEQHFHQVTISSTFHKQLLCVRIPKAQKNTGNLSVFFTLLGSACVKAACKMLVKSTQVIVI